MNIRDPSKVLDAVRVESANIRRNQSNAEKIRAEQPEKQAQPERTQDEYIQSAETVQRGALYDITDVRRGRRIESERRYGMNGGKVFKKIIDVVLPPGIKNLKIFRTEE